MKEARKKAEEAEDAATNEVFPIIESIKALEEFQPGSVESFISSLNTTLNPPVVKSPLLKRIIPPVELPEKQSLNEADKSKIELLVRLLKKYKEPKFDTSDLLKKHIIVEKSGDTTTWGFYYYIIDSIDGKNNIKTKLEAILDTKDTTARDKIYLNHNIELANKDNLPIKINKLSIHYIHNKVITAYAETIFNKQGGFLLKLEGIKLYIEKFEQRLKSVSLEINRAELQKIKVDLEKIKQYNKIIDSFTVLPYAKK